MRIIKPRQRCTRTSYTLFFRRRDDDRGSGFAFPCDEHGTIDEHALMPAGLASLAAARGDDAALYEEPTVEKRTRSWNEPAVGACDCGGQVTLGGFTNTCGRCHADYNGWGQRLAPREQWGEETGESAEDILRVDAESTDDLLEGDGL